MSVARKLIEAHLASGTMTPGEEIGLRIDQTLTQDATGTMVMLELEAMGLDRVQTELSAQYVDHNLIQQDYKNADDHLFLKSACKRFGVWYSPPGNGVSHPLHMQYFGIPGRSLLGSDSHTCGAGALGMLAIGAGGMDVATAMAGQPYYVTMPEIWGVRLTGELRPGVSAKDVILEMLRRHGVDGGYNRIIEYYGPGLANLEVWDRHTIANMGAELGATTTVFPSDKRTQNLLIAYGRADAWRPIEADDDTHWDVTDEIDLGRLEPMIAKPSSPGNVVPVREVVGEPIYQSYLGSSANPGYRDMAIAAQMLREKKVAEGVSLDLNPSSRGKLIDLMRAGLLDDLLAAGGRLHQAGCNGCIGMGQAPASGRNSLRTTPRNFPGRSGTREDSVWLCSPETATASAVHGVITDPRECFEEKLELPEPSRPFHDITIFVAPPKAEQAKDVVLEKGPNIVSLPVLEAIPDDIEVPVLLKVGDDISTDEIMPAGTKVLPFRSNIPEISNFCFSVVDDTYPRRARENDNVTGHAIIAGRNYGQGSSREHAALAPRYLGLRIVIAGEIARIHRQNLVNFGVLPLQFVNPDDHDKISRGDTITLQGVKNKLRGGREFNVKVDGSSLPVRHNLSEREIEVLLDGGLIESLKQEH
ncbi:aconitate hydratase [bacterium]|nr:aconitate hydratase [bacterium]